VPGCIVSDARGNLERDVPIGLDAGLDRNPHPDSAARERIRCEAWDRVYNGQRNGFTSGLYRKKDRMRC